MHERDDSFDGLRCLSGLSRKQEPPSVLRWQEAPGRSPGARWPTLPVNPAAFQTGQTPILQVERGRPPRKPGACPTSLGQSRENRR
jgi:hypothetical protein